MAKRTDPLYQPSILQYFICYAIWLVLALASVFLLLQVRSNLMTPLLFLPIDPRMFIVINNFSTILFAIVILISILVMEHFLRTGMQSRNFWPRVARFIIILAVVLGFSYVIQIGARALLAAKV